MLYRKCGLICSEKSRISALYLADFMRIGLNFGGELISISKELAHVQAYVNIMNYRFSHKICFSSSVLKVLFVLFCFNDVPPQNQESDK